MSNPHFTIDIRFSEHTAKGIPCAGWLLNEICFLIQRLDFIPKFIALDFYCFPERA